MYILEFKNSKGEWQQFGLATADYGELLDMLDDALRNHSEVKITLERTKS